MALGRRSSGNYLGHGRNVSALLPSLSPFSWSLGAFRNESWCWRAENFQHSNKGRVEDQEAGCGDEARGAVWAAGFPWISGIRSSIPRSPLFPNKAWRKHILASIISSHWGSPAQEFRGVGTPCPSPGLGDSVGHSWECPAVLAGELIPP